MNKPQNRKNTPLLYRMNKPQNMMNKPQLFNGGSSAKVITVFGSQCSSKTGNGVTILDNRTFVMIMIYVFTTSPGNGC